MVEIVPLHMLPKRLHWILPVFKKHQAHNEHVSCFAEDSPKFVGPTEEYLLFEGILCLEANI